MAEESNSQGSAGSPWTPDQPSIKDKLTPIMRLLDAVDEENAQALLYKETLRRTLQAMGLSEEEYSARITHPTEYVSVLENHYHELLWGVKQHCFARDTPEMKSARIERFLDSPAARDVSRVTALEPDSALVRGALADASDYVVDNGLIAPNGLDDAQTEPVLHHNIASSIFATLQEADYEQTKKNGVWSSDQLLLGRPTPQRKELGP